MTPLAARRSHLNYGASSCLLFLLNSLLAAAAAAAQREMLSMDGHRSFADSFVDVLYDSTNNENECTSSWGVSMMLDLLQPGGTESTKSELCNILSLCDENNSSTSLIWNETVSSLTSTYDGSCVREYTNYYGETVCRSYLPTIKVANSIWIDTGDELKPSYDAIVGEFLQQTNFTSPNAGSTVNQWVNESTLGLIDSIVDEGPIMPPSLDLLAINSIYFEAKWALPFVEMNTNTDEFYSSSAHLGDMTEETSMANFMHIVDYFLYSHDAIRGYQILQLRYASSDLSMLLVLPSDNLLPLVTSTEVVASLPLLNRTRVALALPKFKFESKYSDNLKAALVSIGLLAPFNPLQGFCDLLAEGCHYLDLIMQKTVIDVNEAGTVAAAVTMGGVRSTSAPTGVPYLFMADHAFQFFIHDATDDLILFEGRVGDPGVYNDESEPALLTSVHKDQDFWTRRFRVDPIMPPAL